MDNEEMKITNILKMLEDAEEHFKSISYKDDDYSYYVGKIEALKDVLDILQG
jgi:hypothetical protein